jgi:pimeloyl-ACP methyl ester carboxylesterase
VATLTGSTTPVHLAPGVTIVAPGLVGTAELGTDALLGSRAGEPERATLALAQALSNTDMVGTHTIEIDAQPAPIPPPDDLRAPDGRAGLLVEVPYLGADQGQVLLLSDEHGVLSWHFPASVTDDGVRGGGGATRFVVPREIAVTPPAGAQESAQQRGLITMIGRKILSVFAFRLLDAAVGTVARLLAEKYEQRRPSGVRDFTPDAYNQPRADKLKPEQWRRLAQGRALVFLHGTFSSSHSGFAGLDAETLAALHGAYDGRVFAFGHPTMSVDPNRNVAALLEEVPPGTLLDVDIIAHSRGGLVARSLAAATDAPMRVGTVVYVGTPNAGTNLVDADHMTDLVDRYTSLLNLIPPGPWTAVTDILEAILTVVKIIGHGAVRGLPGLQAMLPDGPFLANLATVSAPPRSFTVEADFEPTGSLASLVRLSDAVLDRAFGAAANDLVVPTDGIAPVGVPADRRCVFDGGDHVWHCGYFSQTRTRNCLISWLSVPHGG